LPFVKPYIFVGYGLAAKGSIEVKPLSRLDNRLGRWSKKLGRLVKVGGPLT